MTITQPTPITIDEENAGTQRAAILQLLQTHGVVSNVQLNDICFRYGARIHELRKKGHRIRTERITRGLWNFVYEGRV